MEGLYLLCVNFTSFKCSQRGNCERFPQLIQKTFPTASIQSTEFLECQLFLESHQAPPDLIVWPIRKAKSEVHEIVRLRSLCPQAVVLGVMCENFQNIGFPKEKIFEVLDDFLCCPITLTDFTLRMNKLIQVIDARKGDQDSSQLESPYKKFGLIGNASAFKKPLENISHYSNDDAPVLINGETGTGKELFARAIHYCGKRKGHPFIPVNCGALPDHLLENELFGHAKGAFTDASQSQIGLIAEAEGGTVFLDEIDSLSSVGQVKLLRFLQDQTYRPLGTAKSVQANVRIVAATNVDLEERIQIKRFREDLYFRLKFLAITIPPLRERMTDLGLLTNHFIDKTCNRLDKSKVSLSENAREALMNYFWPGNIRELEAVIHRALISCSTSLLQEADLNLPELVSMSDPKPSTFKALKQQMVDRFEREYLEDLLAKHQGNISLASRRAGKERRSFQRLLRKHGLMREEFTK